MDVSICAIEYNIFMVVGDRMFNMQGEVKADTYSRAKGVTTIILYSRFEEAGGTNSKGRS